MKKLFRPIVVFALLLTMAWQASAQIPAGYYNGIVGKKEGDLKTALCNLISNFTLISSYNDLPGYFQTTDVYPNSNRWWDMYSNTPRYAPSFSGLNREHSFPKSWWGGLTTVSAYVDLNHLYPSDRDANTAKSNYPLGMVDTSYPLAFDNNVSRVGYPVAGQGGGAKYVFEPADEYKGDFARTYFYMATCYQNLTWKYFYMVSQNIYPTLNDWSVRLLLKWNQEDPVDEKEINRNEAVYMFQHNRNPFIDYPELAEYIWGSKKGEAFQINTDTPPQGTPELIAPVNNSYLHIGDVAEGMSVTRDVLIKGQNLRGTLDIAIINDKEKNFKISVTTLPAQLANAESGYWLTVTYQPKSLGEHNAILLVSEGGITGSVGVNLNGTCSAVPTLSACTAMPPYDITSDSYTANWIYPAGEAIDYFVVTRTRYVNAVTVEVQEIISEESEVVIDGFDESDSETYSVQSCRLGYRSQPSNVVFVDHSGVTGVKLDEPLVVQVIDGQSIRFICSAPQTGCRIYDVAGRLMMAIPEISHNMDVALPLGVYFVVTDQHATPIKVALR